MEDAKLVWGPLYDGYLDYVTCWYKKAADYLDNCPGGKFAFVSTNSITQGQPVAALFEPLFNAGWHISFAHQSFEWASEAADMAHVHCVIIGFEKGNQPVRRLFTYADIKGEPEEVSARHINAYLIDGPDVIVKKRMKPLSPELSPIDSGSKAVDWGNLTTPTKGQRDKNPLTLDEIESDPIAVRFLRRYVGGDELINGIDRWCLWLVDADQQTIEASEVLRKRVENVRELRSGATRIATKKAAATPHLFGENRQPSGNYLGIPQTFTENRSYATAARLDQTTIASIKLFTADDPDGFLFAIISSLMFMTWQKLVGGRLESRPSFSNTIVWNNFPLPKIGRESRERIVAAGMKIQEARAAHPELSLAEQYVDSSMPIALREAHLALDTEVDRIFGYTSLPSLEDRRATLLRCYMEQR